MREKMARHWLDTSRGRVAYWISRPEEEPARCLVFLHGLTADHTLFERQLPAFREKHTIVVWDAPGHGISRPYQDFSYANCVGDLKAILDREQIDSCVMIGQSMGGYLVQSFLLRWPERVEGFVAIDSCPYGEQYYSKSDRWWLKQVGWMCGLFPHKLLVECVASSCTKTKYARQNMRQALSVYSKRELCDLMGAGYREFLKENQDMAISCPVLALVGDSDRTGKVLQYNRMWIDHEGIALKIIPYAAHNSNADNPEMVNWAIQRFLDELDRTTEREARPE